MLSDKNLIASIGCTIKRGDLVRLKECVSNNLSFRQVTIGNVREYEQLSYIKSKELKGLAGVVLFEDSDCWGTYHIAFNGKIIRAYEDYFQKVQNSLNKE